MNGLRAATAIINLIGIVAEDDADAGADARRGRLGRDAHGARRRSTFEANDFIYALDASRNYDPSHDLEKITAHVLAINSADDFINPPELGLDGAADAAGETRAVCAAPDHATRRAVTARIRSRRSGRDILPSS